MPPYEELAVKHIFEQVKDDATIVGHLHYYPDIKELPDHTFFYNVLGTLQPDYLSNLIKHANRVRNRRDPEQDKAELIAIDPHILAKLENEPYFSSKNFLINFNT